MEFCKITDSLGKNIKFDIAFYNLEEPECVCWKYQT